MDIIVVTPAGRRKYLEKLYLHLLKQKQDFQFWHLWVNTHNIDDINYMKHLEENNLWIKLVYLNIKNNNKTYNINQIHKFFYYTNDPNTVYIRLDDDVVWLEDNFIKNLAKFRIENPNYFLVFGNIVNNNVIDHLHQKIGAIQNMVPIHYKCEGNLWKKGNYAIEVHNQFIQSRKAGELEKWKFENHVIDMRVSINAISWLGSSFKDLNVDKSEEKFLSEIYPRSKKLKNIIYGNALCAHLGFGPQRHFVVNGKRLDDMIDEISDIK